MRALQIKIRGLTSTSGQDGVTGIRFALLPETINTKAKCIKQDHQEKRTVIPENRKQMKHDCLGCYLEGMFRLQCVGMGDRAGRS